MLRKTESNRLMYDGKTTTHEAYPFTSYLRKPIQINHKKQKQNEKFEPTMPWRESNP